MPDENSEQHIARIVMRRGTLYPNIYPLSVRALCWSDNMKAETGSGEFVIESEGQKVQGRKCASDDCAGRRVAYGAAQMAGHVRASASGRPAGYWIVWMDEDRIIVGQPEFLTDTPPTNDHGRVGNGVLMRVLNRAKRRRGWGCYAAVRFLGDGPRLVDERDLVTCERLAKNASYLPAYAMKHGISFLGQEIGYQFFADMMLLWGDGSFVSFRESGLVALDGGNEI